MTKVAYIPEVVARKIIAGEEPTRGAIQALARGYLAQVEKLRAERAVRI